MALSAASALAILTGQFIANGTLYILTFMGIAGGITLLLKDALETSGGAVYAVALVGPLMIIVTMILLYGSLLAGLCASIFLVFARQRFASAARIATIMFTALAIGTSLGLILSRWMEARPDFSGSPLFAPYFFLWSAAFLLLAFLHAYFFPKSRNG